MLTDARSLSLFNLRRPEILANPHPFYRALREHSPIHWDAYLKSWLVSGHGNVSKLLDDPRLSAAVDHEGALAQFAPETVRASFRHLDNHVSFVDGPRHSRLRKPLAQCFRHKRVEGLRGFIGEVALELLAKGRDKKRMDLVADFGYQLPLLVVARLLGLTDVSLEKLRGWSNAWGDVVGSFGHVPDDTERVTPLVDEFTDYLRFILSNHREHPRDDITGVLLEIVNTGGMTEDELVANMMILLTGGHETTANLISSAMLTLLRRNDLVEQLRSRPGLIPLATEEFLRYDSPTQYTARVATDEIELDGVTIEPGHSVVLLLAAANRDPSVFPSPDEFMLDRTGARHVAFGHGPHSCFGASLVRIEADAALTALLGNVHGLRLLPSPAVAPMWRLNSNLRGLATLPVEFDEIVLPSGHDAVRHSLLEQFVQDDRCEPELERLSLMRHAPDRCAAAPDANGEAGGSKRATARVLVVEADSGIAELLGGTLRLAGYEVCTASSGTMAVTSARNWSPDLVVLDVALRDVDRSPVLGRLRREHPALPMVLLAAEQVADDLPVALSVGHSLLIKPFGLDELITSVGTALRHTRTEPGGRRSDEVMRFADLELEEDTRTVRRAGGRLGLSPTEFRLLRYLMRNAGKVLTRSQIIGYVWSYDHVGDRRVVETYICTLRRKVDRISPPLIQTVYGAGYSLQLPRT